MTLLLKHDYNLRRSPISERMNYTDYELHLNMHLTEEFMKVFCKNARFA